MFFSFYFLSQSMAIGNHGVFMSLVQNLAGADKRDVKDLAQNLHRNIMELIAKEVQYKQSLATQTLVQVKCYQIANSLWVLLVINSRIFIYKNYYKKFPCASNVFTRSIIKIVLISYLN